jgi:hypothetical protein
LRYLITRILLLSVFILAAKISICFAKSRDAANKVKAERLTTLAKNAGFEPLTPCEELVMHAAAVGDKAECRDKGDKEVPADAPTDDVYLPGTNEGFWKPDDKPLDSPTQDGEDRKRKLKKWLDQPQPFYDLRADLVRWLSTDPDAVRLVDSAGIHVVGARLTDSLDLSFVEVKFPLNFQNSLFPKLFKLNGAQLALLNLKGSHLLRGMQAYSVSVSTIINLSNVTSDDEVVIVNGKLGSDLICTGANFRVPEASWSTTNLKDHVQNVEEAALDAEDLKARNIKLDKGFSATGTVDLSGAELSDSLDCSGGTFTNPKGAALNAGELAARNVKLNDGFSATGTVDLSGAELSDRLDCSGGTFTTAKSDIKFYNLQGRSGTFNKAPKIPISEDQTSLVSPYGIDIVEDANGQKLYVADQGDASNPSSTSVLIYASPPRKPQDKRLIATINGNQTGLQCASDVAVDRNGRIYVADQGVDCDGPGTVLVYSPLVKNSQAKLDEHPIATISGEKTELRYPAAIALDSDNKIYVADSDYPPTVLVYAALAAGSQGTLDEPPIASVATISGKDSPDSSPVGIYVDDENRLYVASNGEVASVSVYAAPGSSSGTLDEHPITTISGNQTGLQCPTYMTVSHTGKIYVADQGVNCNGPGSIFVYQPLAKNSPRTLNKPPVTIISGAQTNLSWPTAIGLDGEDKIYVADTATPNSALNATELKARDLFLTHGLYRPAEINGLFDLSDATVSGVLHERSDSWGSELDSGAPNNSTTPKTFVYGSGSDGQPSSGTNYTLDGFVYGGFERLGNVTDRLAWVGGQRPFATQPYEQLAKILQNIGDNSDARTVLIAMEREMRSQDAEAESKIPRWGWIRGRWTRLWSWILRWTIGYGYNTWNAIIFSAVLLALGTALFSWGYNHGWIIPTGELKTIPAEDPTTKTAGRLSRIFDRFGSPEDSEKQPAKDFYPYKPFSGIIYSLETLLPFVDLYQAKHWVPNAESGGGRALRWYLWLHTLLGWFFASMIVAGLSGVVQK